MHLAVCDDHIADRKQMERLLGRESDRRISTTGVLYLDSYGSKSSLLYAPMIYDALFLDMTEDGCDAVEIANMLRTDGTEIPIVFCCGKINYRESENLPDNVYFLDKPIQVAELTAMIDVLLEIKGRQAKRLEFRNLSETYYILEEELLYAAPEGDRHMKLHLTDGTVHLAEMTPEAFCFNMVSCESYISLFNYYVLNMDHIQSVSMFKVTMKDGSTIKLSLGEKRALEKEMKKYKESLCK